MKITNEFVQIFWEDGEMVAMLHQNGHISVFTLKKATKQDMQDLLKITAPEASQPIPILGGITRGAQTI